MAAFLLPAAILMGVYISATSDQVDEPGQAAQEEINGPVPDATTATRNRQPMRRTLASTVEGMMEQQASPVAEGASQAGFVPQTDPDLRQVSPEDGQPVLRYEGPGGTEAPSMRLPAEPELGPPSREDAPEQVLGNDPHGSSSFTESGAQPPPRGEFPVTQSSGARFAGDIS